MHMYDDIVSPKGLIIETYISLLGYFRSYVSPKPYRDLDSRTK